MNSMQTVRVAMALSLAILPAQAAFYEVQTTADSTAAVSVGAGTIDSPHLAPTLRSAILAANANPGADTITFKATLNGLPITLTRSGADNTATNGDLDVTGPLTLQGNGAANTIIQAGTTAANGVDKIFSFNPIGALEGFAVSLSGITLRFGRNTQTFASSDGFGGAFDWDAGLNSAGSLTVTDCIIENNSTTDGDGGAIALFNEGSGGEAIASFTRVTIRNNTATRAPGGSAVGGGIFAGNKVALQVTESTLSQNVASGSTSLSQGGGFYMFSGSTGSFFQSSTVSGNSVPNDGGGGFSGAPIAFRDTLFFANSSGRDGGGFFSSPATGANAFQNCTFSSNTANRDGGGLHHSAGAASLLHATVAENVADNDSNTVGSGGGIKVNSGSLTLVNSLIARNRAAATEHNVAGSVIATSHHNLIGAGSGSGGLVNGANGNLVNVADPRIAPLANNGGPTLTIALLAGSPALDAADIAAASTLSFDQRRLFGRTLDAGDADTTAEPDIGAFEASPAISETADQNLLEDGSANLAIHVGETSLGAIAVVATSNNQSLFPNASLVVTGSGAARSLILNPTPNASGIATITLVASQSSRSMSDSFLVTVTAVNDPPSLTSESFTTSKGRPIRIPISQLLANDSDVDGPSLSFHSVQNTPTAGGASVRVIDNFVAYLPPPTLNATDSFVYRISDGLATTEGSVTILFSQNPLITLNILSTTPGPGPRLIRAAGIPGRSYQLQSTANLTPPISWSNVGSPAPTLPNGQVELSDPSPGPTQFYRVIEP